MRTAEMTPTLGDLLTELENPLTSRERTEEIVALVPSFLGVYGRFVVLQAQHLRDLRDEHLAAEREITRLRDVNEGLNDALNHAYQTAPRLTLATGY